MPLLQVHRIHEYVDAKSLVTDAEDIHNDHAQHAEMTPRDLETEVPTMMGALKTGMELLLAPLATPCATHVGTPGAESSPVHLVRSDGSQDGADPARAHLGRSPGATALRCGNVHPGKVGGTNDQKT
jgi:hypothetical protein